MCSNDIHCLFFKLQKASIVDNPVYGTADDFVIEMEVSEGGSGGWGVEVSEGGQWGVGVLLFVCMRRN